MDPQAPNPENKDNDPTNLDVEQTPVPDTAVPAEPVNPVVPLKTEDDVFQSANQNMELDHTSPAPQALPVKQPKSKKPLAVILIVLVLVGAAVGAWFFMSQSSDEPAVQQVAPEQAVEAPTYEPKTIAYAFRAKSSDPVALFTRPAAGGERTEIQKLTRDAAIVASDTTGAKVAFVDDATVYASIDHGTTYKKVYEGAAGAQITDMVIDNDQTGVLFAVVGTDATKNELTSVDFNGENKKVVFTNDEPGIILLGWSSKNNRAIFQSYAKLNSDGLTFTPFVLDTATSKKTRILQDVDPDTFASIASSADTSQLIYVTGVIDTATEGPGVALKAPYNVSVFSVKDNKSTTVSTIGKAGEKNTNGTTRYRSFLTGFAAGINTPYYVEDKQLSLVRDNEGLVFFESDQPILDVYFVSEKYVITSTGEFNNYSLFNYDVATKKSTSILQGDANTTIFGVATD
jgi:hypothetical protein